MAIPVHIPYDEGLVREVARPDNSTGKRVAQSPFELGGLRDAIVHQTVDFAYESEVVGRIQEERGPRPAWPQRFHHPDGAGRRDRIAAGVARSILQAHLKAPNRLASGSRPVFRVRRRAVDHVEPGRVRQDVNGPIAEGQVE